MVTDTDVTINIARGCLVVLKGTELRENLKNFIYSAWGCRVTTTENLPFDRIRLHGGCLFKINNEVTEFQNIFAQNAIKKLGSIKGHYKSLDKALWDFFVSIDDLNKASSNEFLDKGLSEIENASYASVTVVRPCPLIRLPNGIKSIEIGSVSIQSFDLIEHELSSKGFKIVIEPQHAWGISTEARAGYESIFVKLAPMLWSVEIVAADPVKHEETLWKVDVALSLLRMEIAPQDLGQLAPRLGDTENHPFEAWVSNDNSLTFTQTGVSLGGSSVGRSYELSNDAVSQLANCATKAKFHCVMAPSNKSLAARFHQGCGWLTRGRRATDRSERLLYFFTALESLLSDSDKTSPVVQTIARHGSVIYSDDNSKRIEIAKQIKDLYSIRSSLIHTGKRSANNGDGKTIQVIVESIFYVVWEKFDLNMKHDSFVAMLSNASYGLELNNVLNEKSAHQ